MYLQLHDGPEPLNTVENPLYPGPKPYFFNRSPMTPAYPQLGANGQFDLPKDLFLGSKGDFFRAIQEVVALYRSFQTGAKKDPTDKSTFDPSKYMKGIPLALLIQAGQAILQYGPMLLQSLNAIVINQRIQAMYNANRYNVQNLNALNGIQIAGEIRNIDRDLEDAFQTGSRTEAAALSQFRLIYQRAFEQKSSVLGIPILPVALAVGAYLLFKRKWWTTFYCLWWVFFYWPVSNPKKRPLQRPLNQLDPLNHNARQGVRSFAHGRKY